MARVLRLANVTQTDTIDLISGTLALEENSWQTVGPSPGFGLITETMGLVASTDDLNIANAAAELDERLEAIQRWQEDPLYAPSWWLEFKTEDESARRSLLYGGNTSIRQGTGWSPFFEQDVGQLTLALTRHPLWEATDSASVTTTALTADGSAYSLPTVPGTAPARMYQVDIYADTGGVLNPISEIWLGLRPDYGGSSAFVPIWEAEDGTATAADTTEKADATASGGKMMQCDFTSYTTLHRRQCITINDVAAGDYGHFKGRYLVLGRVKCSAADTTIGLQLKPGYYRNATDSTYTTCEETYITNTVWRLVPLGEVQIPPEGAWTGQGTTHLQYFGFDLAAEQVSGAGYLDFDYLLLMPAEHMVWISGASMLNNASPHYYEAQILTHENDEQVVIAWYNEGLSGGLEYTFRDWWLPIGNNKLVIAGQPATLVHDLADTFTVYLYYYTRWRTYRGSGTT